MEVLRVTYAPDMTAEEFARMWPKFKAWQQAEAAFKDAPPEAAQVVDQHFWELKGNQQAEPGADERAARLVEDAAQRLENSGFTAHAEAVRAAQSGQRAGVAEKDKDSVVVPRWLWDRMNAAPTQQQEQGE